MSAPLSVGELGYTEADVPALVEDALKQQRLLALAPKSPTADDLADIFRQSMGHP